MSEKMRTEQQTMLIDGQAMSGLHQREESLQNHPDFVQEAKKIIEIKSSHKEIIRSYECKLQESLSTASHYKSLNKELAQQNKALTSELEAGNRQKAEIELSVENVERLVAEYQQRCIEFEKTVEAYAEEKDTINAKFEALFSALESITQERDMIVEDCDRKIEEVFQHSEADRESAMNERNELIAKCQQLEEANKSLETKLHEALLNSEKEQVKLSALQAKMTEQMAASNGEKLKMEEQISQLLETTNTTSSENIALQNLLETLQLSLESEVRSKEDTIQSLEMEKRLCENIRNEKQTMKLDFEQRLSETTKELSEKQDALLQLRKEMEEQKEKLKITETVRINQYKDFQEALKLIEEFQIKFEAKESEFKEHCEMAERYGKENEMLRRSLQAAEENESKLNEDIANLGQTLNALRDKEALLMIENESLAAKVNQKEGSINEENCILKEEVHQLDKELQGVKADFASYRELSMIRAKEIEASAEERINKTCETTNAYKKEFEKLRSEENAKFIEKIRELEKDKTKVQDDFNALNALCKNLQKEVQKKSSELLTKEDDLNALKTVSEKRQADKEEIKSLKNELEKLRYDCSQKNIEIKSLKMCENKKKPRNEPKCTKSKVAGVVSLCDEDSSETLESFEPIRYSQPRFQGFHVKRSFRELILDSSSEKSLDLNLNTAELDKLYEATKAESNLGKRSKKLESTKKH